LLERFAGGEPLIGKGDYVGRSIAFGDNVKIFGPTNFSILTNALIRALAIAITTKSEEPYKKVGEEYRTSNHALGIFEKMEKLLRANDPLYRNIQLEKEQEKRQRDAALAAKEAKKANDDRAKKAAEDRAKELAHEKSLEPLRQPLHPKIPFEKQLEKLDKQIAPEKMEQAEILVHAIKTLASELDVRDDQTLEKAEYPIEAHGKEVAKTAMHRRLAEILLSKETIAAAFAALDPNNKISEKISVNENIKSRHLQYIQDSKSANAFLKDLSPQIPGLVFLLQAATLKNGDLKKASDALWELRNDKTADDIIKNDPRLWDADCMTIIDGGRDKILSR